MTRAEASDDDRDLVDVLEAARLAGRSPETIRRWIWSGRLAAQRRGNRHVMWKDDVVALSGMISRPVMTLAEWASTVRSAAEGSPREASESAADLVLEDRRHRSATEGARDRRR
jgi:helix-turn-helix protein